MKIVNALLIEDDMLDAKMVEQLLQNSRTQNPGDYNIQLTHASLLEVGLNILKNQSIEIVLLDLHLPDGKGSDLVSRLNENYSNIPIIILTGLESEEAISTQLVQQGAQDYLPKKNLTADILIRSIRYAIQRHSLRHTLQQQTKQLQETNEELKRYMYLTSHDLRAPLVNLQGFSTELLHSIDTITEIFQSDTHILNAKEKIILEKELSEKIPKSLRFIQSATKKMDYLTAAVLQLSRLGERNLHLEEIDTTALVRQSIESLQHQIQQANAEVIINNLPTIIADRITIEHTFSNILDNAIKYLVPKRAGKISIQAHEQNKQTTFSISDNGRGISDDDQQNIFDTFYRASNTNAIPGDGAGMPFVRALIKRHGGDIWFTSKLNEGSTFYFSVPKQ